MDMRSAYLDTELMLVIRSKDINKQLEAVSYTHLFSIPLWQGGLFLRLATAYLSPSSHLQM